MYVVANVEKFLADQYLAGKWIIQQEEAQAIVRRANDDADENGVLMSGRVNIVFGGDKGLATAFFQALQEDFVGHSDLALPALRARGDRLLRNRDIITI